MKAKHTPVPWIVDDSDEGVAAYLGQHKHTPGPWETGSTMTRVEVLPEGWKMPMCIADCHPKHAPESEAERVANARLIAAAPELLEACKSVVEFIESCKTSGLKPKPDYSQFATELYTLRAAIARAEGGAS